MGRGNRPGPEWPPRPYLTGSARPGSRRAAASAAGALRTCLVGARASWALPGAGGPLLKHNFRGTSCGNPLLFQLWTAPSRAAPTNVTQCPEYAPLGARRPGPGGQGEHGCPRPALSLQRPPAPRAERPQEGPRARPRSPASAVSANSGRSARSASTGCRTGRHSGSEGGGQGSGLGPTASATTGSLSPHPAGGRRATHPGPWRSCPRPSGHRGE